ncbi:MAG: SDR family NAD(P)-dependent oxidoreductase [Clostridiales Family XIII bacterium]|jgi:NAD(P)-dependent dehydrogenase (short-subunit alcohol dehydrogenase family)|nr:SDR family NAD(P)-dependent oxidoreductase [Clostridiales Family XIII bacterium]
MDYTGKICFITGGGAGAGFGQAQIFSEAGCRVVIADIRRDALDDAMRHFGEKGAQVHPILLDVTDSKAYAAAADETERVFGAPPEIVIQTAGVNAFGPAEASTYDDFDWVVGVNLRGVYNGLATFVPRMIKAGRGGHLVAVASLAGFGPDPLAAPYSCSKAAVINIATTYHEALKPYGIKSMVFCPGNMNTQIHLAHKTRPKNLSNSGYFLSEESAEMYRQHNILGMDIREAGRLTMKGMEEGVVIYIPYENRDDIIRNETQRMIDYCTPEGMARLEEEAKKGRPQSSESEDELSRMRAAVSAGLGKAREGNDWVDPDRRRP